ITCERKRTKSATATKYPQKSGLSTSIIGEKEKISPVSALSSFKKSRSVPRGYRNSGRCIFGSIDKGSSASLSRSCCLEESMLLCSA
ncbi:hypothetical protein S83_009002, partial [Arachis hypogaea]